MFPNGSEDEITLPGFSESTPEHISSFILKSLSHVSPAAGGLSANSLLEAQLDSTKLIKLRKLNWTYGELTLQRKLDIPVII